MIIKGFVKNSFADWDGKIVSTIFCFGCNFKCGFCFNPELVGAEHCSVQIKNIPEKTILHFLQSRKGFLDGVCLSIAGDESVVVRENKILKHIPIQELWDDKKLTTSRLTPIPHECQKLNCECLTKDRFKKATEIIRHKTTELYEVIAGPGNYSIKVTGAHSIFVLTKEGLSTRRTARLKKGDFVLSPTSKTLIHDYQISRIDILEYLPEVLELNRTIKEQKLKYWRPIIKQLKDKSILRLSKEINCNWGTVKKYQEALEGSSSLLDEWIVAKNYLRHKTSKVKIPRRILITKEFCEFLGYAVAEGCARYRFLQDKRRVVSGYEFALGDEIKLAKRILYLYRQIFSSGTGIIRKYIAHTGNTQYNVIIGNRLIAQLINRLIGKGFMNKRIPTIIFNTFKENKIAFLRALAEGDGHHRIRPKKSQQEFSIKTGSRLLGSDIIFLAKTLEVFTWIEKDKKARAFRVVVSCNDLHKLNIAKNIRCKYTFKTRVEGVPRTLLGYALQGQKRIVRKKLKKWLRLSNISGKHKAAAIFHGFLTKGGEITEKGKNLKYLFNLTKNWDIKEIKLIRRIKLKRPEYVYDLVVPRNHSFVGGTGSLLVHNTGGEPLLQPDLDLFLKKVKKLGFLVKLDHNGSMPDKLYDLMRKKVIDYIAMDIKAPLNKYKDVAQYNNIAKIKKSIDLIISSEIDHEFRSTILPALHSEKDILQMAKMIKKGKCYFLQTFKPKKTLDPVFMKCKPYNEKQMQDLAKMCSKYIKTEAR